VSLFLIYVPILISAINLITPIGLSFKPRTSKVEKTDRLKRATYLYFFLVISISLASFTLGYGYLLALAANMFSYFIYDQSLRLLFNYEKNRSRHFVNDASKILNSAQIPVIGITVSYSKTTTKNILAQILVYQIMYLLPQKATTIDLELLNQLMNLFKMTRSLQLLKWEHIQMEKLEKSVLG
jgi:hypothetical protein